MPSSVLRACRGLAGLHVRRDVGLLSRFHVFASFVGSRKRFVYVIKCPNLSAQTEHTPMIINNDGVYVRKDSKDYYICGRSPTEVSLLKDGTRTNCF